MAALVSSIWFFLVFDNLNVDAGLLSGPNVRVLSTCVFVGFGLKTAIIFEGYDFARLVFPMLGQCIF